MCVRACVRACVFACVRVFVQVLVRRGELRGILSGREPKFSPASPLPLPSSLSSRKMVEGSECVRKGGREGGKKERSLSVSVCLCVCMCAHA